MVCIILAIVTFILYAQILAHSFITYDDLEYVRGNVHVQDGLTEAGLEWAFNVGYSGNWHPVTWISHMLDCQIFGIKHPGGHHFTSLILHVANSLLLFLVLRRMTGAVWKSALVAALFAWHPLHVESVAWIAERKDVLSTFFGMLTVWYYLDYVQAAKTKDPKTRTYYWLTALWLALGLMSKPMLVTWPFVLLLLDIWPLGRIADWGLRNADLKTADGAISPLQVKEPRESAIATLFVEKLPFFGLALFSSVITFIAQRKGGAVTSLGALSFGERLPNVFVSYVRYLGKMIWPAKLSVFYPLQNWQTGQWMAAAALVLSISVLAVWMLRRAPYLFVGWFWYLGMLVPVVGLVQVGLQSIADRYTYLPLVGIFIAIVWGLDQLAGNRPQLRSPMMAAAVFALAICVISTMGQLHYWKNTETLFSHAWRVTPPNTVVLNNLGIALESVGRPDDALTDYKAALKIDPRSMVTYHLMGLNYAHRGDYKTAIDCYNEAIHLGLDVGTLHYNLGNALTATGRLQEAAAEYSKALELEPGSPDIHNNLGAVLVRLGKLDEAVVHFQLALELKPNFPEAHLQLGGALIKKKQLDQARAHYTEAVRLKPEMAAAQFKLALLMAGQGDVQTAIPHFQAGLAYDPTNADAHFNLGAAYAAIQNWPLAAQQFAEAERLHPGDADTQKRLAEAKAKMENKPVAPAGTNTAVLTNKEPAITNKETVVTNAAPTK